MAAGKRNIFLSDDFYQKDIFTNNFVLSKNINNNWTEGTVAAGRQNLFLSDDFFQKIFLQKEIITNINNNWTEGRVVAGKRNIFLSDDRPASSPPTLPDNHDG